MLLNDGMQINPLQQTLASHIKVARIDPELQFGFLHSGYIPREHVRSLQGRIHNAKSFPLTLLSSCYSPTPKWLKWLLHVHLFIHSLMCLFKWPNDESWLWLAKGLFSRWASRQQHKQVPVELPFSCLHTRCTHACGRGLGRNKTSPKCSLI